MKTITQIQPERASVLARAFVNSLRTISAERTREIADLVAERDSYRQLAHEAMSQLAEMNTRLDRERASRMSLLAQYRALQSGQHTIDTRLVTSDDAIVAEQKAA